MRPFHHHHNKTCILKSLAPHKLKAYFPCCGYKWEMSSKVPCIWTRGMEPLGHRVLLKDALGEALRSYIAPLLVSSLCIVSEVEDVFLWLLMLAACCHASFAIMNSPLGTISPNNYVFYKLLLVIEFCHKS